VVSLGFMGGVLGNGDDVSRWNKVGGFILRLAAMSE